MSMPTLEELNKTITLEKNSIIQANVYKQFSCIEEAFKLFIKLEVWKILGQEFRKTFDSKYFEDNITHGYYYQVFTKIVYYFFKNEYNFLCRMIKNEKRKQKGMIIGNLLSYNRTNKSFLANKNAIREMVEKIFCVPREFFTTLKELPEIEAIELGKKFFHRKYDPKIFHEAIARKLDKKHLNYNQALFEVIKKDDRYKEITFDSLEFYYWNINFKQYRSRLKK